jgi:membrane dipeptidase
MRWWLLGLLGSATAIADPDLATRAKALHAKAIIVDTHVDAPMQLADKPADVAKRGATDHFDLPRAKEGGLTAPIFSIFVDAKLAKGGAARRAHELIDVTLRTIDANPDAMQLATSVADIRAAKQAGKLGVLMGIEGGHAIEDSMAVLRDMYRLGVRYMTLTHVNTNHWADSSGPLRDKPLVKKTHGGLNDFGRAVVKEMNRLGMIVDISHTSDDTVDDVLAVSRAPVMASHSSCRALTNVTRNLTDDQIKRIAKAGGVVMINIGSKFIDQSVVDWYIAHAWPLVGKPRANWTKVVDHIEHVIAIAGENAVGLGTDFDGIVDPPTGLADYAALPKLTEEMLRRGWSEERVKKVLGENFLAFFARVEAVRVSLAKEPPSTATLKRAR